MCDVRSGQSGVESAPPTYRCVFKVIEAVVGQNEPPSLPRLHAAACGDEEDEEEEEEEDETFEFQI